MVLKLERWDGWKIDLKFLKFFVLDIKTRKGQLPVEKYRNKSDLIKKKQPKS